MLKLDTYNIKGEKSWTITLPDQVFGAEVNMPLLAQAIHIYRQNQRQYNAHAKIRSEVRGGGRKPWRQKGTGRARQGSIRSPQWRGGGIIFGPRSVDKRPKRLSKKMRAAALRSALSLKANEQGIFVFDSLALDNPKTAEIRKSLTGLFAQGNVLFVAQTPSAGFLKSVRNIPGWQCGGLDMLNIYNILDNRFIVLEKSAVDQLATRYTSADEPKTTKPAAKKKAADVEADSQV
jgi:large subunit ribosomal protein L4